MVIFLVQCPNCGNTMKTMPTGSLEKAKKQCVYCGKIFKIQATINKSQIVKVVQE